MERNPGLTIPRYNDVVSPVPWRIVISGFHCIAWISPEYKQAHTVTGGSLQKSMSSYLSNKDSRGRVDGQKITLKLY